MVLDVAERHLDAAVDEGDLLFKLCRQVGHAHLGTCQEGQRHQELQGAKAVVAVCVWVGFKSVDEEGRRCTWTNPRVPVGGL